MEQIEWIDKIFEKFYKNKNIGEIRLNGFASIMTKGKSDSLTVSIKDK